MKPYHSDTQTDADRLKAIHECGLLSLSLQRLFRVTREWKRKKKRETAIIMSCAAEFSEMGERKREKDGKNKRRIHSIYALEKEK